MGVHFGVRRALLWAIRFQACAKLRFRDAYPSRLCGQFCRSFCLQTHGNLVEPAFVIEHQELVVSRVLVLPGSHCWHFALELIFVAVRGAGVSIRLA